MITDLVRNKKTVAILALIMLVGIFLRVYKFHDFLRFCTDQSRDAAIVRDVIIEGDPLPLIGPKALGTAFKMGPIFYYFQYVSAKIFGTSPDKMAYPDVFFSVLTIPLFFFFFLRYFSRKISLMLTALFGISFFAVLYGRFAWNPNSLPFFSLLFLFAFLELADRKKNKKVFWSIIVGIALGIGIQMHTLYMLIVMPTFFVFSAYLISRKLVAIKNILIIFGIILFLNFPQLISEVETRGENTRAFSTGITQKSDGKYQFPKNLAVAVEWNIQSNMMFLAAFGNDRKTDFDVIRSQFEKKESLAQKFKAVFPLLLRVSLAIVFSFFGYLLIILGIKREKDANKKLFLQLIAIYVIVAFLVLATISHVLILRYLIILQFVPFVLLGLIAKFLLEKNKKIIILLAFIFLGLSVANIYRFIDEIESYSKKPEKLSYPIWGEEEFLGNFIVSHSRPDSKVEMLYTPQYANKFIRPLVYFNDTIRAPFKPDDGTLSEDESAVYFSIIYDKKKDRELLQKRVKKSNVYVISDSATYGRFAIYEIEINRLTKAEYLPRINW